MLNTIVKNSPSPEIESLLAYILKPSDIENAKKEVKKAVANFRSANPENTMMVKSTYATLKEKRDNLNRLLWIRSIQAK